MALIPHRLKLIFYVTVEGYLAVYIRLGVYYPPISFIPSERTLKFLFCVNQLPLNLCILCLFFPVQ